eukprot:3935810-Rhodomonas_salina.5
MEMRAGCAQGASSRPKQPGHLLTSFGWGRCENLTEASGCEDCPSNMNSPHIHLTRSYKIIPLWVMSLGGLRPDFRSAASLPSPQTPGPSTSMKHAKI